MNVLSPLNLIVDRQDQQSMSSGVHCRHMLYTMQVLQMYDR